MSTGRHPRPSTIKAKKTVANVELERVMRWRATDADGNPLPGFLAWLDEVMPRVKGPSGTYVPYELPPRVLDDLRRGLGQDVLVFAICWPRRWGKSTLSAMIALWRFMTFPGQQIACIANALGQAQATTFSIISDAFKHTPILAEAVQTTDWYWVTSDKIERLALGSSIFVLPANAPTLHGRKLSLVLIGELHAALNDQVLSTATSATMDTKGGLVLVDSHAGPRSSPVAALWRDREVNPGIVFSYVGFETPEAACDPANLPHWIDPARLRAKSLTGSPAEFALHWQNLWAAADERAAFPDEVIAACRDATYPIDPRTIAGDRRVVIGVGIDRAAQGSHHGDGSYMAVVAKTVDPETDDPIFYLLELHRFETQDDSEIRRAVQSAHDRWGINRLIAERYEMTGLHAQFVAMGIESELQHATLQSQAAAFNAMTRAAREGRLRVNPEIGGDLLREMPTFRVSLQSTGHSRGTGVLAVYQHENRVGCHDDAIFATGWAIHALRDLDVGTKYEIGGIACEAPPSHAALCILNGGALVPMCSTACRSFLAVKQLHAQHLSRATRHLTIEDFFAKRVRNIGAHTTVR